MRYDFFLNAAFRHPLFAHFSKADFQERLIRLHFLKEVVILSEVGLYVDLESITRRISNTDLAAKADFEIPCLSGRQARVRFKAPLLLSIRDDNFIKTNFQVIREDCPRQSVEHRAYIGSAYGRDLFDAFSQFVDTGLTGYFIRRVKLLPWASFRLTSYRLFLVMV